jgi:hypothetical protein
MKQLRIKIQDGITPYKITPERYVLGRQYENAATEVVIERPDSELLRTCICVVEADSKTIDNIPVIDDKFVITSNLSQYASVVLGFVFYDESGYEQPTKCEMFQFAPALRPLNFAPLSPESARIIFNLTDRGFARIEYEDENKNIAFKNITGIEVARVRLPFATETELSNAVEQINEDIGTERQERTDADEVLQKAINDEATARENADNTERDARQAADTTLQNNIDTEKSERQTADVTLQSNINAEKADRQSADAVLQTAINANATAISIEKTNRQTADATLQANIDAEATARNNADKALQDNIDAETLSRTTAINNLNEALNTEKSDRQAADTINATAIATEATNRHNADTTLQSNMNAEADARGIGDLTLRGLIDDEIENRKTADTTLQTAISTEATARATADGNEQEARIAGDNANAGAIATEAETARAAEQANAGAIADVATELTQEAARAMGVEDEKVDKAVFADVTEAETPNGVVTAANGDYFTSASVDQMSLHISVRSVVDGELLSDTVIPLKLASEVSRGLMSKENVQSLNDLISRVASIEGKTSRYIYTASDSPTAKDIDAFVQLQGQASPYEGVAVVIAGTYHIWHYYDNDGIGWRDDGSDTVNQATNTTLGIVIGSNETGKIFIETDGSMSVIGFDDLTDRITSLENSRLNDITVESGTNNGTIKVTKNKNGTNTVTDNIAVKGLGSAAYTASSAYATAAQGTKADSAYQKPIDGIPNTDLNSGAVASLANADSALQSVPAANSLIVGGFLADPATETDTQEIRIGADGKAYTAPSGGGSVDVSGKQDKAPSDDKRYVGKNGTWEELGEVASNTETVTVSNPAAESPSGTAETQADINADRGAALEGKEPTISKKTAFNKDFGTAADTVCEGNDSRLNNARPASDVSTWAKATAKPNYTAEEVGAATSDDITTAINNIVGILSNLTTQEKSNIVAAINQIAAGLATLDGSVVKTTGDQTINGQKTFNSAPYMPQGFSALGSAAAPSFSFSDPVNVGMELGRRDGTGGTPYIDFHTDGNPSTDFNSRILASGGDINVTANKLKASGYMEAAYFNIVT